MSIKSRNRVSSLVLLFLVSLVLQGCSGSPHNSFGLKTAEYGECRRLEKGEIIRYKNRLVSYVCEDRDILFGKPYKIGDDWYFKAGYFNGKSVENISQAKVEKVLYNICQFQGAYGTGSEHIRKFYFNIGLKACLPFEWSGTNGVVPFDSKDECEANCYY